MNGLFSLLAISAPSGFGDIIGAWDELVFTIVLPIMFIVLGAVMVIVGIWRGSKIALADNEDSKKKAVKSLIWWLVGVVIVFIVAFGFFTLFDELAELFTIPKSRVPTN